MRTEDFVSSAEKSPALRLDPSTVVRIQEGSGGTARLTLSYGEHNTQVGVTSPELVASSSHLHILLLLLLLLLSLRSIYEGVSKKFPDWPPGARIANGTALYH
jgi:hypothetical protein